MSLPWSPNTARASKSVFPQNTSTNTANNKFSKSLEKLVPSTKTVNQTSRKRKLSPLNWKLLNKNNKSEKIPRKLLKLVNLLLPLVKAPKQLPRTRSPAIKSPLPPSKALRLRTAPAPSSS